MTYEEKLRLAEELALNAGKLALKLQDNLIVQEKPHGLGPVSNGDFAADKLICDGLKHNIKNAIIVSEESYLKSVAPEHDEIWFIDPIDGTSSYIVKRSDFVTMIGLVKFGKPILGVVYQPATDTMWSGLKCPLTNRVLCKKTHKGHQVDLKIKSDIAFECNTLSLMASRTSRSKKQLAFINSLKPKNVLFQSSVGLKSMMVLEGQADLYVCWSHHTSMWDTCAPLAIAQALGAFMVQIDGRELCYNGPITHGSAFVVAQKKLNKEFLHMLTRIDEQKF